MFIRRTTGGGGGGCLLLSILKNKSVAIAFIFCKEFALHKVGRQLLSNRFHLEDELSYTIVNFYELKELDKQSIIILQT